MRAGATLVCALLLVSGCAADGSDDDSAARPSARSASGPASAPDDSSGIAAPPAERCGSLLQEARSVRVPVDGVALAGITLGTGPRGVVLVHTRGGDACDWAPHLPWLEDAGYRVLAIDQRCRGASECPGGQSTDALDRDVRASATWLREQGARTVIAVGGSQGSSVVLAAAARPDSNVDGVVALSGDWVDTYYTGPGAGRLDSRDLVAQIAVPVLYAVAHDDDMSVPDYRALASATTSDGTRFVALRVGGHAMEMLGLVSPSAFYRTDFADFLRRWSA